MPLCLACTSSFQTMPWQGMWGVQGLEADRARIYKDKPSIHPAIVLHFSHLFYSPASTSLPSVGFCEIMEKARRRHVPAFGEWNYYSSSSTTSSPVDEPPPPHSGAAAAESSWWWYAPEPEACSDAWFR